MSAPEVVQEVVREVQRTEQLFDEFTDAINSVLQELPEAMRWVADQARELWSTLTAKVEEFFAKVDEALKYVGDSGALRRAEQTWLDSVVSRTKAAGEEIGTDQLRANYYWSGRGAEAYKDGIAGQRKALAGVGPLADTVRGSLESMAAAIDTYWATAFGVITALAVELAAAVVSAETVVGPIIAVIAAIITAVAGLIKMITAFDNSWHAQVSQLASVEEEIPGRWPHLVSVR
ncbi:MAG: hypothetical protein ABF811_03140 [Pseudoclavibacter sp.]